MESINDTLKDKLQRLVSYLCQVTKGFENIAADVECTELKTAIFTFSVETNQYADEICNMLQEVNIHVPLTTTDQPWKKIESDIYEQAGCLKGGEIIALCNNCEAYFNKFYEDVLLEYLPLKNFKDIIAFQIIRNQVFFHEDQVIE